ncbi:MAG: DegT/DnrJ/EryC1/StrS family aminotransferase [Gammaproteobacteria bacterium]|nr:DegT/DnrJ/EryC1/StrS family aminotransferase [Gammaproteobacteria bacterium]
MAKAGVQQKYDALALLGGPAVRPGGQKPYNTIGAREKQAVIAVLDSGELSGFVASAGPEFWGGTHVRALEAAFKQHFGVRHAIAVNSATSGLHCATLAMGLNPGDEVVVPPYTMSATATAVVMAGAVPVFADIEPQTFGLDPQSVRDNLTPYTKGIIAVNLFGHPARLNELRELADEHGLFLIEDNAQAPDAMCGDRKAGTVGDCGIFSLNRHKTMQSGEGGVLITNDDKIALKAALVRNHGEVVVAAMAVDDIVNTMGLNLRMTEMEAAVAGVQFDRLAELNEQRQVNAAYLTRRLAEVDGIAPPDVAAGCSHVYYLYAMKYDAEVTGIPRNIFCEALTAEGFYTRAGYVKPIYLEPMYQRKLAVGSGGFPFTASPRNASLSYRKGLCPVTERMQDHELMLTTVFQPPSQQHDLDLYVEAIHKVIAHREALLAYRTRGAAGV